MRIHRYSKLFSKALRKLKGKELQNVLDMRDKLKACEDLNEFKNLKYDLKRYKRVHVNDSFVILFFGDDGTVYFVDYAHHDEIYRRGKQRVKKYDSQDFS